MSRKAFALNFRHLRNKVSQETGPTGKTPLKFVGRFIDFWAGINMSIRTKILLSLSHRDLADGLDQCHLGDASVELQPPI